MYIMYTHSLKCITPQAVHVKIYADDVKMYIPVSDINNIAIIQETLDKFLEWCEGLDLRLSVNKCAVLHFGHNNPSHTYTPGTEQLAAKSSIKDLGVLTTNMLNYTPRILEVVADASRKMIWIMRAFILKDPSLYVRLYKQYVLPILLYSSPVWNLGYRRDRKVIVKMHKKFVRRVAYRCNIATNEVRCEDVERMLDTIDRCPFYKVLKHPDRTNRFFTLTLTNTRAGINVQAKTIAKKEIVNKMFAWRTARNANHTQSN